MDELITHFHKKIVSWTSNKCISIFINIIDENPYNNIQLEIIKKLFFSI